MHDYNPRVSEEIATQVLASQGRLVVRNGVQLVGWMIRAELYPHGSATQIICEYGYTDEEAIINLYHELRSRMWNKCLLIRRDAG